MVTQSHTTKYDDDDTTRDAKKANPNINKSRNNKKCPKKANLINPVRR
jgi:hypothetical protein